MLTPDEQKELDDLRAQANSTSESSNLTPEEQKELDELRQVSGIETQSSQDPELSKEPLAPGDEKFRKLFPINKKDKGLSPEEVVRLFSTSATFGQQPRISALTDKFLNDKPYDQGLNENRSELNRIRTENPVGSAMVEIPTGMAATGPLNNFKKLKFLKNIASSAALGAGYGSEQQDLDTPEGLDAVKKSAAYGSILGSGGEILRKGSEGLEQLPGFLKKYSKKAMLNATGATGTQIEKFAKNAGDELYDRNLVKAFDSPDDIAKRLGSEMKESNTVMDSVLKELHDEGVKVDKRKVIEKIKTKISALSLDPAKKGDARALESILKDIEEGGSDFVSLSEAETTKRGFQDKSRSLYGDPERGIANKTAGRAYRETVEETATGANPELAQKFKEAKKTYGLAAPIQEAAQKRANQQNQIPWGGILDVGTVLTGGALGGGEGDGYMKGLGLAAARRFGAPRSASTAGALLKSASKFTEPASELFPKLSPMFSRASKILSQTTVPAATEYMTSERDAEYRQSEE